MMRFWFCFLFICSLCLAEEECCFLGEQHARIAFRYTTPQGIGYDLSYATMELFLSPECYLGCGWVPFLDGRGHVFNNGRWAANAGVGLRYAPCERVWGGAIYYNYRNTPSEGFHQISAGLESLGEVLDFRINGYFPIDQDNKRYNRTATFQGNELSIRYSQRFAMTGANAEVGYHFDCWGIAPFYFAAGPYYLTATGKHAWGGEVRARLDLFNSYLRIEGNGSYDSVFKWIGQAQVSLNFPILGGCKDVCIPTVNERAVQRVDFFEIIPVVKHRSHKSALNPATGHPWIF